MAQAYFTQLVAAQYDKVQTLLKSRKKFPQQLRQRLIIDEIWATSWDSTTSNQNAKKTVWV